MKNAPRFGLSVIVPIAQGESKWKDLLAQLVALPIVKEIIFSSPVQEPPSFRKGLSHQKKLSWICGPVGRAKQQNLAARAASQKWLWFLHADSVLFPGTQAALSQVISKGDSGIYYFDLKFVTDEFKFMRVNEAGAWFRSRIFALPFGDQGFLVKKEIFSKLGRFDEATKYGEDHLLIWKAHQAGCAVCPVGFSLGTSARKYQKHGWLQTTALHIWLTAKQASPELLKTACERYRSGRK